MITYLIIWFHRAHLLFVTMSTLNETLTLRGEKFNPPSIKSLNNKYELYFRAEGEGEEGAGTQLPHPPRHRRSTTAEEVQVRLRNALYNHDEQNSHRLQKQQNFSPTEEIIF